MALQVSQVMAYVTPVFLQCPLVLVDWQSMQFSLSLHCLLSKGLGFSRIFLSEWPDFSITLNSKPVSLTIFWNIFCSSEEGVASTKMGLKIPPFWCHLVFFSLLFYCLSFLFQVLGRYIDLFPWWSSFCISLYATIADFNYSARNFLL